MSVKAKILLVEDDASLGFVVKDSLEDSGYEVLLCNDGESGWQQFMRNNVDICLLDVMLPRKDGMTLATQIRKKNEKVPIIFLTARNMDEDKIAGFKAGGRRLYREAVQYGRAAFAPGSIPEAYQRGQSAE